LGVIFINKCSENQQVEPYDTNAQEDPPLAGCPWYKDVIYFLQELWLPDGMQRNKARNLKIKSIKYFLVGKNLLERPPGGTFEMFRPTQSTKDYVKIS
jgi:hypothetical protein